jgi:hypothetical protein
MNEDFIMHEDKFEYEDKRYPAGGPSFCQLDVVVPKNWKDRIPTALVLFTDPGRDSGVSITNATELIAQKVWSEYLWPKFGKEMTPESILFVERYGRDSVRKFETLDRITYTVGPGGFYLFHSPRWKRLKVQDIVEDFPQLLGVRA